jgi:chromosome segregation ATPase
MQANTQLKPVEEIVDEVEISRRVVAQAEHEKAEIEKDLAAVTGRLDAIEADLAVAGSDWKKVSPLLEERRAMRDRLSHSEELLAKAEASRIEAQTRASAISGARLAAAAEVATLEHQKLVDTATQDLEAAVHALGKAIAARNAVLAEAERHNATARNFGVAGAVGVSTREALAQIATRTGLLITNTGTTVGPAFIKA